LRLLRADRRISQSGTVSRRSILADRKLDNHVTSLYILGVPLYIANQEAEDLARELAAATGETITDVVIAALRDRREKMRQPSRAERMARLLEITERTSKIIGGRKIDFDELYDEDGLPK
jgi:antitoxin VapB